jgi:hypothetical protein
MSARTNHSGHALRTPCVSYGVPVLSLLIALSLSGTGLAQNDVNMANTSVTPAVAIQGVPAVETPTGPHVAEATGDDVYIRSGAGTNFYKCGKLYRGDRVQVVSVQQDWSCIVPPPGCFSWVPMQYVSINLDNPTIGIITGDNVRTYAGSDYVEPMYSTSEQVRLFRGDNVKLLGEEKDDYYKIAPPKGAFLWVSRQFLKPVQTIAGGLPAGIKPVASVPGQAPQAPVQPGTEAEFLDVYRVLNAQVSTEHDKPLAEQDYTEIKAKLQEIAKNPAAGKAVRYAELSLKQIERFELVRAVEKEIELRDKELAKTTARIEEARETRLAQIGEPGKFAVTGRLEASSLFNANDRTKRYRILDDADKTVCYIAPTGAAVGRDLSKLIGKKVGVTGEIQPNEATGRALIKFTEVVALDTEASAQQTP